MSDESRAETEIGTEAESNGGGTQEIFSAAFFAALTGISGRAAGQDPGSVVNEAFTLAERAVERMTTGKPVLTESERQHVAVLAVADKSKANAASFAITSGGGRFPRPSASTP